MLKWWVIGIARPAGTGQKILNAIGFLMNSMKLFLTDQDFMLHHANSQWPTLNGVITGESFWNESTSTMTSSCKCFNCRARLWHKLIPSMQNDQADSALICHVWLILAVVKISFTRFNTPIIKLKTLQHRKDLLDQKERELNLSQATQPALGTGHWDHGKTSK